MIHKRIAFLCMLLPCTLWGQTDRTSPTGRIEFLSPEAASLMRYVDYPVSHLTGVPDIRIPLHTVQIGKISLPLTLMFHTDNYSRPNQLAGSVGKGWSLSTELQITRQVNGLDDLNPSTLTPGYYYASDIPTDYREGDAVQRSELNAKELYYGRRDEEPDRFYYRLLDKSGAFYFRHRPDGSVEAVPVPYNGVKIEYGSDRRFTVWDTDGTKYVFSLAATDTEQPISGGMDDNIVIAWKCESIYSPQGEQEVSFTYTDDYPRFVTTYNDRIEIYDRAQGLVTPDLIKEPDRTLKTWDDITKINQYPFWRIAGVKGMEFAPNMGTWLIYRQGKLEAAPSLDGNDYNYGTIDNLPSVHSKKLIYKHIRKIDFRGGQMVFDYPRAGLLGSISILNQVGDTIKKIRFEQDYVDSHGEEDDYWRRLWSVRSGDELYTFDYSFMVGGGSDYITDYWGYKLLRRHYGREANVVRHNARVSRGEGVFSFVRGGGSDNAPSAPPDTAITIGHIDPTEVFAYDGTPVTFLKIGYPTGGSAEFQMGQHRYRSKYGNKEPKGAGGYRIERIRYRDSDSKLLREKIYRYGPDEDGCGHVKYEPYFDEDYWGETRRSAVTEQQVNYYYEQVLPDGRIVPETFLYSLRKRTYLMGSNQSLSFESGSTVHYDEVAEYEMDGGRTSGKTVYKYDGDSMPTIYSTPLHPYPLEPEQWYLAPLDSVIRYEYRNGSYEWVQREKYVYNKYLDSTLIYRCRVWSPLEAEFQTNVTGRDFEQWKFDKVKGSLQFSVSGLHTGCLQLVTKEVQTRDAQGRVSTDRTHYRYDSPNRYAIGRVERTMSDGTTLVEQTLYPEDYDLSGGGTLAELVERNIVSVPVERIRRRDGLVVSGELFGYDECGNPTSQSRLEKDDLSESLFRLSNKSSAGAFAPDAGSAAFSPDAGYAEILSTRFDDYGNLIEITGRTAPRSVCYLWGYNGLHPVAELVGCSYGELTSVVSLPTIHTMTVSDTLSSGFLNVLASLRKSPYLSSAHISTYTYRPLVGMLSATDPRGFTTYYEYDSFGRLRSIHYYEGTQKKTLKYYEYRYKNR